MFTSVNLKVPVPYIKKLMSIIIKSTVAENMDNRIFTYGYYSIYVLMYVCLQEKYRFYVKCYDPV